MLKGTIKYLLPTLLALGLIAGCGQQEGEQGAGGQQPGAGMEEQGGGEQPGAGTQPSEPTAMFNQLDQDQNGMLSQEEAQQQPEIAQSWNQLDTDGDGNLTQEEFAAFEPIERQQSQ